MIFHDVCWKKARSFVLEYIRMYGFICADFSVHQKLHVANWVSTGWASTLSNLSRWDLPGILAVEWQDLMDFRRDEDLKICWFHTGYATSNNIQ